MLNVDMIEYYFALSHKLAASRRRRIIYPEKFYNEQTMHSYYTYIEGRWAVKGFRQDVQVVKFLDAMLALDRYIEILEFKLKHFRLFLRELPMKDKKILIGKYRSRREVPDSRASALLSDFASARYKRLRRQSVIVSHITNCRTT